MSEMEYGILTFSGFGERDITVLQYFIIERLPQLRALKIDNVFASSLILNQF